MRRIAASWIFSAIIFFVLFSPLGMTLGQTASPQIDGLGGPSFSWFTFSIIGDPAETTIDKDGNVLVVGRSKYNSTGPNYQAPLHEHSAGSDYDIVILKLNKDGQYLWHTYFGYAYESTYGSKVEVDDQGNIYALGSSEVNYWTGPGGEAPLNTTGKHFVVKLTSSGAYLWHTYSPVADKRNVSSMVLDTDRNIYLSGSAPSNMVGPAGQQPLHGCTYCQIGVVKLDQNGAYQWHTLYGGNNVNNYGEYPSDIALGPDGELVLTGISDFSWQGPDGQAPLYPHHSAGDVGDIFLLNLKKDGSYQWHSFYGGTGMDGGSKIVRSGSQSIAILGYQRGASWNGPDQQPPLHPLTPVTIGGNAVILQVGPTGVYQWHTFYRDTFNDIQAEANGGLLLSGKDWENWTGPNGQAPINAHKGTDNYDIMVMKLGANGQYQWHSYYGGYDDDNGMAVTTGSGDQFFLIGQSQSPWLGPAGQQPVNLFNNSGMNFVVIKMEDVQPINIFLPMVISKAQ